MEMVGVIFALIGVLIPVSVVGVIIYFIANANKQKDGKKKPFKLTTRILFQIYLYVISLITLAATVAGASAAIKGALSYPFGLPFSYTLYQPSYYEDYSKPELTEEDATCYEGEEIIIDGNNYCADEKQRNLDIVNGSIIFVSMGLLFGIHQFALSRIPKKEEWLEKGYTFISLIGYSVVSIISIFAGISLLSNYLILENSIYQTTEAPAIALAVIALAIPIWIYFINRTLKLKDED